MVEGGGEERRGGVEGERQCRAGVSRPAGAEEDEAEAGGSGAAPLATAARSLRARRCLARVASGVFASDHAADASSRGTGASCTDPPASNGGP